MVRIDSYIREVSLEEALHMREDSVTAQTSGDYPVSFITCESQPLIHILASKEGYNTFWYSSLSSTKAYLPFCIFYHQSKYDLPMNFGPHDLNSTVTLFSKDVFVKEPLGNFLHNYDSFAEFLHQLDISPNALLKIEAPHITLSWSKASNVCVPRINVGVDNEYDLSTQIAHLLYQSSVFSFSEDDYEPIVAAVAYFTNKVVFKHPLH